MSRPAREQFLDAMSHYYKTERDRTERCLADLVNTLSDETTTAEEQVVAILDRLIAHYSRSENLITAGDGK